MEQLKNIAKIIPKEVYVRSADALAEAFTKLIAPLVETTDGMGRYIRQKFDAMVDEEKALATYSLERAIDKAKEKNRESGELVYNGLHLKSFVICLEEVSKETDYILSEMWTNLLAGQILGYGSHPSFIKTLSNLSSSEALLLESLSLREEFDITYQICGHDLIEYWIRRPDDVEQIRWTFSCILLCQLSLTNVINTPRDRNKRMLVRTKAG